MSPEQPLLTPERLRTAFAKLDGYLSAASVTADVFLFGGAAMVHLGLNNANEILANAERVLGEPIPLRQRQIIEDELPEAEVHE